MNKQELLDKAVEYLRGVAPEHEQLFVTCYGDYSSMSLGHKPVLQHEYICTREEFTQRARELGWINGYKWGVAYPTNGKKPDLPDDCIVGFFGAKNEWRTPDKVINWAWDVNKKFRIVDQRYKPVEVEYEPVVVSCAGGQGGNGGLGYTAGVVVGRGQATAKAESLLELLDSMNDKELYEVQQSKEAKSLVELLLKRKADEEKREFVEAAIAIADKIPPLQRRIEDIFKSMYAEGCRFK